MRADAIAAVAFRAIFGDGGAFAFWAYQQRRYGLVSCGCGEETTWVGARERGVL